MVLRIRVKSADEIQLTPLNDESRVDADRIEQILKAPVAVT